MTSYSLFGFDEQPPHTRDFSQELGGLYYIILGGEIVYLTVKQQMKLSLKKDYKTIKKLCHIAKNLANESIYNVRQCFFIEKRHLNYYENWKLINAIGIHARQVREVHSER